jgi:nucleotide-binding universal stress UspA family protein
MLAIKNILHPTDFSSRSDLSFRLACSLARDYGARLLVMHVVEVPTAVYGEGIILPPPEESWKVARDKLNQMQLQHPNLQLDHLLVEGSPVPEILRVANEFKFDVIVMGTHGRTGLSRALMGSVTERVLRKAPCPVVSVKEQQSVSQLESVPQVTVAEAVSGSVPG